MPTAFACPELSTNFELSVLVKTSLEVRGFYRSSIDSIALSAKRW
jgi:hypothetical protein